MRLIFKKGKQRKLIERFKKSSKVCWGEVAMRLNVHPNALKEWRYETVSLPLQVYLKIDNDETYKRWITDRKTDSWGQSLGGKKSSGRRNRIKAPKNTPVLAEFYGIILGDGCVYTNKKYGAYQIRVACHPYHEKEFALFVQELFANLFCLNANIVRRKKAIYVCADSKDLADFLLKNLPGLKRKFSFPTWIYENDNCLRAFVRGLIDTDGSVYRLSNKNPSTIRIGFKNADTALSTAYRKAMMRLGFHPSKIIYRNVFLTRKADIENYLKEIGFHNAKHSERIKKIAPSSSGQICMLTRAETKDTRL